MRTVTCVPAAYTTAGGGGSLGASAGTTAGAGDSGSATVAATGWCALVSAGLALGLAGEAHIASSREPGVVSRRLAGKQLMLTTYLLRRDAEPCEMLARFIERVAFIDSADGLDSENS